MAVKGEDGAERLRVMVVDDHALFRRGLEMVLEEEDDIELVGEAGDGAEAVDMAAELLPDVVLMDVRMPKRSGIEACRAIKDVAPAREDRHADDQRRGGRPLRRDQGRRAAATCSRRSRSTRSPTRSGRSPAASR